jgi:SAM-dependent methyltransferase
VLDVGCGTGLSFGALEDFVGPQGHVLGIEPCPEMLAQARQRVQRQGWTNVRLLQASAQAARMAGQADAALFFFTHDVLRSATAVRHVVPTSSLCGRGGLQWRRHGRRHLVLGAALHSVSTLEGMDRPWSLLASALRDFTVETLWGGGLYLAHGTVASEPAGAARLGGHPPR